MTKMRELPKELIEEILCRVPATDLKRFQSTCKWWDHLIKDDKRFATKHSEKAPKQFLVLELTNDKTVTTINVNLQGRTKDIEYEVSVSLVDSPTLYSPFEYNVTQILHCDGLLLCTSVHESSIVVWNPLTGHIRWIEVGDVEGETFVLGYYYQGNKSSYTKIYKILRFEFGVKGSKMYDFDSDSWRICLDDMAPLWDIYYSTQVVSLEGKAYLFARDKTGVSLLSFDFSTEKFVPVLILPYRYDCYKTVAISVVKEEKLSVILRREDASETEVWVTNKIDETQVVSWTKVLALKLSPHLEISSRASFLLYEEKKVVVWYQMCEVLEDENEYDNEYVVKYMVYIVGEDNKVHKEEWEDIAEEESCWPAIFNYVPSLDQIVL